MLRSGRKLCIVGTSGFARETLCCVANTSGLDAHQLAEHVVFMEADERLTRTEIHGVQVIKESAFCVKDYEVVVAIGDPEQRKRVVGQLPRDTSYATVIHPSAVISEWVEVGEGSIITAGVIVTCDIRIGKHAHLNLQTTVGHDCVIGDFFSSAPGANISGSCQFGDCVYFGTNASVRQGIRICNGVTVGMGAVVVKDITEPGIYAGSPAKRLLK